MSTRAGRTDKAALTAEAVTRVLEEARPVTVAALAHGLGYRGSVSSWLRRRLGELVADLESRLAANRAAVAPPAAEAGAGEADGPEEAGRAPSPVKAAGGKPGKAGRAPRKYPRAEHNPFRMGAYATAYDVLAAAGEKGVERSKLVAEVARLTGKAPKLAYYDCVVVASSRKDGKANVFCLPAPAHSDNDGCDNSGRAVCAWCGCVFNPGYAVRAISQKRDA